MVIHFGGTGNNSQKNGIKNNTEIQDGNKWENYYEKKVTKLPLVEIQEPNQKLNRKITEKSLSK